MNSHKPNEYDVDGMKLSREEIVRTLDEWQDAWDSYYLDRVMTLFHEDIYFENWTGARVRGKDALRRAWENWFDDHGGFRFTREEVFVDEAEQKALIRWRLDWPSMEEGYEGMHEVRRGVDVIHFRDGLITNKLTYSKTSLEIDGQRVKLTPGE